GSPSAAAAMPPAGMAISVPPSGSAPKHIRVPQTSSPETAIASAVHVAGNDSPATAGADYARPLAPPAPVTAAPASRPAPARPAPAPHRTAAAPSVSASGPWRAQLGAFGVPGNADALWAKVKNRPELSGHAKLLVPAGRLTKLQAGGFASHADASAACSRLTAGGFTCLAVRN
ncbi:SPOR domain-containing protein, partial [Novosphingobium beihaiensis]